MNKSNVLAIGVLLVGLGLYLQSSKGMIREELMKYTGGEGNFTSLTTILFWAGLIVVIISILIRPKKRRIVIPAETEVPQKKLTEVGYGAEEALEASETGVEQAYEEVPPSPEEVVEESMGEETVEEEEKPGKVGEVIGFCPRCGAPVTEGVRYCRKCGLKLK
ncbi:MAG: zinc ribbon domain-containing protein [Crenarchaeota archaeon]|nr:zinc ribbon domain-containing protein [Thermoproteota archaeon]MDW8033358.1 zinc ribbon domain-containing protein [Nitrososphaerota archaeon]